MAGESSNPYGEHNELTPNLLGVNPARFYRYGGMPIKFKGGKAPLIPPQAMPHQDLQLRGDPKVEVLSMWEPAELARYQEILTKVADGEAELRYEDRQWVITKESWKIMVSWVEIYYTEPSESPVQFGHRRDVPSNGHAHTLQ